MIRVMSPALIAVFLAGCGGSDRAKNRIARVPEVETLQPRRSLPPLHLDLMTTVEPLNKADICARTPGVVAELPAEMDIGRYVEVNDVMAKLAIPDLEAQKAQKKAQLSLAESQKRQIEEQQAVAAKEVAEAEQLVKKWDAEVLFRQQETDRVRELVRRDAIQLQRLQETEQQMRVAQASRDAAQAAVETRKAKQSALMADIEVAEAKIQVAGADLQQISEQCKFATIVAPFSGTITKRWVDRGATIHAANSPLFTLMNQRQVRLLIDVPERFVPQMSAVLKREQESPSGTSVQVRFPAFAQQPFPAHLTRQAEALDPTTRTMRMEMVIDNPKQLLKPGMYGKASIILEERSGVLTVPSTALVRRNGIAMVFVVDDESGTPPRGKVRAVTVELGQDDGRFVEIRSGLTGQERVIARGNSMVEEGDIVRPLPLRE